MVSFEWSNVVSEGKRGQENIFAFHFKVAAVNRETFMALPI